MINLNKVSIIIFGFALVVASFQFGRYLTAEEYAKIIKVKCR